MVVPQAVVSSSTASARLVRVIRVIASSQYGHATRGRLMTSFSYRVLEKSISFCLVSDAPRRAGLVRVPFLDRTELRALCPPPSQTLVRRALHRARLDQSIPRP